MNEYHKIQTLYLRDPATNHKTVIEGQFAKPEFEYLARVPWMFTEKVDGTNIRIGMVRSPDAYESMVVFGGRTDDAQIPGFLLTYLQQTFTHTKMVWAFEDKKLNTEATLYGEGYGPRIQKGGGRYRNDPGFILFDVVVGGIWLERQNVEDIAGKLGVPAVPVVGKGTVFDAVDLVKAGFTSRCAADATLPAEGVVLRPQVELCNRRGERVISKLKVKDFAR